MRRCKNRQKMAGGFRTASGRQMYCEIMSVIETVKRRGLNTVSYTHLIWTRWELEAARMRLKLNTQLGAVENYYEVPFGVVERKPYGIRTTARGEWPVHRFAAMENTFSELGIALLNKGTVGVEAEQGILKSTLLRAPVCEYAGMVKDDTSSDHGEHWFDFRVICYKGSWRDSKIAYYGQAYNCLLYTS